MRKCQLCGKGSIVREARAQKQRGHYNPAGKKRKYPNLQKTRLPEILPSYLTKFGFKPKQKVLACTQCIKKMTRPQRAKR